MLRFRNRPPGASGLAKLKAHSSLYTCEGRILPYGHGERNTARLPGFCAGGSADVQKRTLCRCVSHRVACTAEWSYMTVSAAGGAAGDQTPEAQGGSHLVVVSGHTHVLHVCSHEVHRRLVHHSSGRGV